MIKEKIKAKSFELGFDLFGVSKFKFLENETKQLEKWLSNKYNANMSYMERNIDKRKDVKLILENCNSIISLGMNYYVDEEYERIKERGKVSRYAWGRDYHFVIWEKLKELIEFVKDLDSKFEAKSYVDTGPVMDKVWATKSGLGWQGKHSNIINKNIGSWFFIANILTNLDFQEYNVPMQDFCGSCTACIDACPTNAIVDNYTIDSNKCISYLTIENKKEISEEFVGKFDNWIFGCDICQDVCPWNNKFATETKLDDFLKCVNKTIDFSEIENMTNSEFKRKFKESPLLRSKLKGIKRNAQFLQKSTETK